MSDRLPVRYFLLVYRLSDRSVSVEPYEGELEIAGERYRQLEADHRGDDDVEVVLVGAESIETIHRTHSHYFVREEKEDNVFDLVLSKLLDSFTDTVPPGGR